MREWFDARYSLPALWSAYGAIVLGYLAFVVLERLWPAHRPPKANEVRADIRANLIFFLVNPTAVFAGTWLASPAARYIGGPLIHFDLRRWGSLPVWSFMLAFVPFLVFDFFYYWYHRTQHRWGWLWEVHRLHHSEAAVNVLTSLRHHWLEEFFRAFFIFLPMNWLIGMDLPTSAVAAVLIRQWNGFFHSNIRLSLGALTPIIAGPQYHRVHHSIEEKHFGKNFAAFFPVWDWVFRTYWRPAREEWPATGLTDTDGLWTTRDLLFAPFIGWARGTNAWLRRFKAGSDPEFAKQRRGTF